MKIDKERIILDSIRENRDSIKTARLIPCTCSGFVLAYEGRCQCKKGKAVDKANDAFWKVINNL